MFTGVFIRTIISAMMVLGLTACGGGGSDSREASAPQAVVVPKDFSFEQEGRTMTLAAGQYSVLQSVYIDCRRNGGKCAMSDRFASLLPSGDMLIGNYVYFNYKGTEVGYASRTSRSAPWVYEKFADVVLDETGRLEMSGWLEDNTVRGQSGKIGIAVKLAGQSTYEVTGNPNTLISAVSAGSITEVTSETITPGSGPKKLGGIRVVCPTDAIGGCRMTMEVELTGINVPVGTALDVYAGNLWWYSTEIKQTTGEKFILSSPAVLTPGQVVWVSVQGAVPSGKIMIRELKLVTGDGFQIFMKFNFDCFEGNILTGGCKG